MPRIFVPGPSVNPNLIGSPSSFLSNIGNIAKSRRASRQTEEALAQDLIFKNQQAALNERKQDFAEGASERARKQANLDAQIFQSALDETGGGFTESFLNNPETQKLLIAQGITDPDQQRQTVEAYAAENKKIFSDPTKRGKAAFDLVVSKGGSLAQAQAAQAAAISESGRGTLDKDLAKSLFIKPGAGTSGSKLFNSGLSKGGSGSTTPLQGIPNQVQSNELTKQFFEDFNVESDAFNIPLTEIRPFDFGDHDLTEADVRNLQGEFSRELRPETVLQTLQSIGDAKDGTIKFKPEDIKGSKRASFLELGRQIEAKANEPRGGGAGAGGQLSLADLQAFEQNRLQQIAAHNTNLVNRTAPAASTFSDRLSGFRSSLGVKDNTRQGGNQGGSAAVTPTVAPPVVAPAAGSTGSAGLDSLLAPPAVADPIQTVSAPPGTAPVVVPEPAPDTPVTEIAPQILQKQVADAQDRISIFGNGTAADKKIIKEGQAELQQRADDVRIAEVEAELREMPRPDQRTLAQTAYARSLEKELRDLK